MSVNAILKKAGLWTDGFNLDFWKQGGLIVRGLKQHDMVYNQHASAKFPVGTRLQLGDRTFYYAKAGEALVAGGLVQSAAKGGATTLQTYCAVSTAGTVGGKTVTVTIASDTLTANQFKDGFLITDAGSAVQGGGQCYKIKSHPAGSGNVTFTLYDKQVVAISTNAKVSLVANKYRGVIRAPATTATGIPVGVPLIAVTSAYYFWLQTWGICPVRGPEADIAAGHPVVVGLTKDTCKAQPATAEDECVIGDCVVPLDYTGAKAQDWAVIDLKLAP